MVLPSVDKLAKDKNGVKYLLVRKDVFVGIVDAKRAKTKFSERTVCAFLTTFTRKRIDPEDLGGQRNRICWRLYKTFAKPEGKQLYSAMIGLP